MKINITARHMDLSPALKEYIEKKTNKTCRHYNRLEKAHFILSVEKHRHIAEAIVSGSSRHIFKCKEEAGDMYSAIDNVMNKIDNHINKHKGKMKGYQRSQADNSIPGLDEKRIKIETRQLELQKLSLEEAIEKFNENEQRQLMFINSVTQKISLLSNKGSGKLILIEARFNEEDEI